MPATIFQYGSLNTTALTVPGLFVGIEAPSNILLNGVPTNVLGYVGTATWGPVGQVVTASGPADGAAAFGQVQARKHDLMTYVNIAVLQGANNFRLVRVTDGTDTAAQAQVDQVGLIDALTLSAKYTGSLGNTLVARIAPGTALGTWRFSVGLGTAAPEVYDNIAGATPAAIWTAMAAAISFGNGPLRGPSALITAVIGTNTGVSPATATIPFAGGTDGAANVTAAMLLGVDAAVPRTGMYALRGQGCSVASLCDADDPTTYTTQVAYGLSEGSYMILTGPAGDTIANALATKATAGLDTYGGKLMFGDWLLWNDLANGQQRYTSPAAFISGLLANLSPEQSTLNKPLYGVIGSQKSAGASTSYSQAELGQLIQAGFDVVGNPCPAGTIWGAQGGYNASSNAAIRGDNYTRMTNFIVSTIAAGMGIFVGQTITGDDYFRSINATLNALFSNMQQQGMLPSFGTQKPYNVQCDSPSKKGGNNPPNRLALGYVQADCQAQYCPINAEFIVNLEGGQTVTVTSQPSAA